MHHGPFIILAKNGYFGAFSESEGLV